MNNKISSRPLVVIYWTLAITLFALAASGFVQ